MIKFSKLILIVICLFFTSSTLSQIAPLILHQGSDTSGTTNRVALGTDKSIIISGSIADSLTLGSNTLVYSGSYVSKYDSSGLNLWIIPAGSSTIAEYISPVIFVDENNDIYVLGKFNDTCHISNTFIASPGYGNSFIAKLTSTGSVIWVKKITNINAAFQDMNIDRFGNILLTGNFTGVVYIDGDSLVPQSPGDILTVKLDNNGNLIWMKRAGNVSPFGSMGFSISSDYSGNVIIGGNMRCPNPVFDTILIPISNTSVYYGFIAKYDSSGAIVYAKISGIETSAVCSDSAGNVFATGRGSNHTFVYDTNSFYGGTGTGGDYIMSVNANGILQWAKLIYADFVQPKAITSDNNGNCFVTGKSRGTTKIFGVNDTLTLVNNIYPQPNNSQFIIGLNNSGNPFWGNLIKNNNYTIGPTDIQYRNCQLAFTGYFIGDPIYYNSDSLVSQGSSDGYVIVEGATCNYIANNIKTYGLFEEIKCFPNPFLNELTISTDFTKQMELVIYDIFSRKLILKPFVQSITLNTDKFVKGLYLYEVRDKNGVIKKGKVVKE